MFEIIPSPGTQDREWSAIEKKIELVKPFAKTIHIDIIDGKFVNNTTLLDPEPYKKYTQELFFEVHLMVDNPISYLKPWAAAGFKRFIGQIEKMPDQAAFIAEATQLGEVGLAIDGPTPPDRLTVSPLDLDVILFMMISAGFSGQQFQEDKLEKIKKFAEDPLIPIAVDGGINENTIGKAYAAGVRRFTATSAIFNSENPAEAYVNLQRICEGLELKGI